MNREIEATMVEIIEFGTKYQIAPRDGWRRKKDIKVLRRFLSDWTVENGQAIPDHPREVPEDIDPPTYNNGAIRLSQKSEQSKFLSCLQLVSVINGF